MGTTCDKIRIERSAKHDNKKAVNETMPHLTEAYKVSIKNNWQTLKLHIANIGIVTYLRMFETRPELLETFLAFRGKELTELERTGLLSEHALRVMSTIDKCITRLDEPSYMRYLLRDVGAHHRKHGVPSDNLQIILPHFISAIKPYIHEEWSDSVEEAWSTFLSLIFYHIREGMTPAHSEALPVPVVTCK